MLSLLAIRDGDNTRALIGFGAAVVALIVCGWTIAYGLAAHSSAAPAAGPRYTQVYGAPGEEE
jgi:hypothetical protein